MIGLDEHFLSDKLLILRRQLQRTRISPGSGMASMAVFYESSTGSIKYKSLRSSPYTIDSLSIATVIRPFSSGLDFMFISFFLLHFEITGWGRRCIENDSVLSVLVWYLHE